MSASGTLFIQTFVFLIETRISRASQEIRDLLAHGRRRRLSASGPSKTSSAMVAGAWLSTKKLMTGSHGDCAQVRSCNAGDSNNPTRRAVRNKLTHAKPCQLIHRTPRIRDKVVAAAHAEGKTVTNPITQTAETPQVANPGAASAPGAKTRVQANPNADPCRLPS